MTPTNLTDDDIAKMEPTSLTDSDIANMETKPGNIMAPGNLLQQAAKAIQQTQFSGLASNPLEMASQAGNQVINSGLGPAYNIASTMKTNLINQAMPDNPIGAGAVNIASDPMTWAGGEGAAKAVGEKGADIAEGTGEFFKGLGDRKLVKSGTQIQEGVRNTVMDKFLGRTKAFDEALKNLPETTHDVTNEMNQLKNMSETNPAIKDAISNSPIAQKLLYGTETGVGKLVDEAGRPLTEQVADQSDKIVSTRDLQNMRNQLGKNFDYSDPGHDWQLGKSLSDLRLNQAAPFPEEMGQMSKDYKDTINNFNVVKPYLKQNRLGSSILKGFGGEGGAEVRNSLNYFLGDEGGKRLNNIYQAGETSNKLVKAGEGTGIGVGGAWLLKKILGH